MKKTPEQLKLKAKILKESIQLYMMEKTKVWYDHDGREHHKKITCEDAAHYILQNSKNRKTIQRWITTGRISPVYERKLVEMKILKRGIW